jgi:hypothetical protein
MRSDILELGEKKMTNKMVKLIIVILIITMSFVLFIMNMTDTSTVFPSWLMAYKSYFMYMWLAIAFISLIYLLH